MTKTDLFLPDDLMICNTEEPMCIAGVFGGIKSGISAKTKNIFLESACFSPDYIRKTGMYHQLKTDASFRFERGTDPNMTVYALKRAALLIKEIAGGAISSEVVDVYPKKIEQNHPGKRQECQPSDWQEYFKGRSFCHSGRTGYCGY